MKEIKKYINEITGRMFNSIKEALKAEEKSREIKELFSFWENVPKDNDCEFANGLWCYQRTNEDYFRLKISLVKAIKKHEPWIAKQYDDPKIGGLNEAHAGSYMIGRYLDDGDSELYYYHYLIDRICPICLREWGQPYYAMHCSHDKKSKQIREQKNDK